jgi:hypothetical protein
MDEDFKDEFDEMGDDDIPTKTPKKDPLMDEDAEEEEVDVTTAEEDEEPEEDDEE